MTAASDRSVRELALEMHDLSVHLWNALEREHPGVWTTSQTRGEVETMQKLLGELPDVEPEPSAELVALAREWVETQFYHPEHVRDLSDKAVVAHVRQHYPANSPGQDRWSSFLEDKAGLS